MACGVLRVRFEIIAATGLLIMVCVCVVLGAAPVTTMVSLEVSIRLIILQNETRHIEVRRREM